MQNLSRSPERIDALVAAFEAAEYRVDTGNDVIVIRVGENVPALDRLLGNRPWAVMTACNPDGRLCNAKDNAAAQQALEESLGELAPTRCLKTCNRDPAGHWPDEPAWLFTPGNFGQADLLARRFGQRAIVTGVPGAPAQLRVYADPDRDPGTPPGVAP